MKCVERLIKEVVDRELCTGCGTCIGMCPSYALLYDSASNIVKADSTKCIDCNICNKVCPGADCYSDFHNNTSKIWGHYQHIYNVKSLNKMIWEQSASGGAVTQILVSLLERGIIDGAVVMQTSKECATIFESAIVTTPEEVIQAASSKYIVSPHNSIISKIKSFEGKLAYVGLPCEVQGIRKAMDLDNVLANKIEVVISLFCGFNLNSEASDYLLKKAKIKADEVESISYRKKHIDSSITGFEVYTNNGRSWFVNKHGYTLLNLVYSPKRCIMCYDYSGESSDISVGDAWECGFGYSRVITRSDLGQKIWELVKDQCQYQEITETNFEKAQGMVISFKKKQLGYRLSKLKNVPNYGIDISTEDSGFKARVLFGIWRFTHTKIGRWLFEIMPFGLVKSLSGGIKGREIK